MRCAACRSTRSDGPPGSRRARCGWTSPPPPGRTDWPAWRAPRPMWAWSAGVPDEVTTSAGVLRVPPLPDIPEAVRGRELVVIDGAIIAGADQGAELLAPLRALAPEIDTFGMLPASKLSTIHMDPEHP